MGKLIGADNVSILLGSTNISAYFNDASPSRNTNLKGDLATFGDTAAEYGPGIPSGDVILTGLYDDTATNIDAVLNTAFASAAGEVFTICNATTAVSKPCRFGLVRQANHTCSIGQSEYTKIVAKMEADGGLFRGVIHHALTAETGTMNGAAQDNGAASSNGGRAAIWVPICNATPVTCKYQDSMDGALDWQDIATFAVIGATTAEIVVITGAIRQYTRFIISSFMGTTITPLSALARL